MSQCDMISLFWRSLVVAHWSHSPTVCHFISAGQAIIMRNTAYFYWFAILDASREQNWWKLEFDLRRFPWCTTRLDQSKWSRQSITKLVYYQQIQKRPSYIIPSIIYKLITKFWFQFRKLCETLTATGSVMTYALKYKFSAQRNHARPRMHHGSQGQCYTQGFFTIVGSRRWKQSQLESHVFILAMDKCFTMESDFGRLTHITWSTVWRGWESEVTVKGEWKCSAWAVNLAFPFNLDTNREVPSNASVLREIFWGYGKTCHSGW